MITKFKIFEKYNDNKLNEKIIKYFNDVSEEIIEIINTFDTGKKGEIKKILNKILFLIKAKELKTIEKDNKTIKIYIDNGDKETFIYDFDKETFEIDKIKKAT